MTRKKLAQNWRLKTILLILYRWYRITQNFEPEIYLNATPQYE